MSLNSLRLVGLMSVFMSFTGCATIVTGGSQTVSFNSSPDGADVAVSGQVVGKTPCSVSLKRATNQSLTFTKAGYKTITMRLETRVNGWFWGNIVLGGFIGSTTDGISGAVDEYSPGQYLVTMVPEQTTRLEEMPSLSANQKAKEFIVTAYKNLRADLTNGQGQYLSSLLDLLKVQPADQPEAIKKIQALTVAYPNIVEFADHVVALFPGSAVEPDYGTAVAPTH